MFANSAHRWSLVLALLGGLAAAPAAAQGSGKPDRKDRPELIRRGDSKAAQKELDRAERRRDSGDRDRRPGGEGTRYEATRDGGPPFCRSGEGHPVHGRGWCEEKGYGIGGDPVRYDDRYDDRYGSYEREHGDFHLRHDRECRMRAAERPLDLPWQIRVRKDCKERHDAWHSRNGTRHE